MDAPVTVIILFNSLAAHQSTPYLTSQFPSWNLLPMTTSPFERGIMYVVSRVSGLTSDEKEMKQGREPRRHGVLLALKSFHSTHRRIIARDTSPPWEHDTTRFNPGSVDEPVGYADNASVSCKRTKSSFQQGKPCIKLMVPTKFDELTITSVLTFCLPLSPPP